MIRHTLKKAVMVIYRRAGFGWTAVDKRATASVQDGRYSRERMIAKRLVSALFLFLQEIEPVNIKDIVKDNNVRFVRYRQGVAYYGVKVPSAGDFIFPVPLADIGDATLELEDKAILFMRYIRRAMRDGSFVPLAS